MPSCRARSSVAASSPQHVLLRSWMHGLSRARARLPRSGDGVLVEVAGAEQCAAATMAAAVLALLPWRRAPAGFEADRFEVAKSPSPAERSYRLHFAGGEANASGVAAGLPRAVNHVRTLADRRSVLLRNIPCSSLSSARNFRDAGCSSSPLSSEIRGPSFSAGSFLVSCSPSVQMRFRCCTAVKLKRERSASGTTKDATCRNVARLKAGRDGFAEDFDVVTGQVIMPTTLGDEGLSSAQCLSAAVTGAIPELRAIHATASVHPDAWLGEGVDVGAFCIVGPGVKLGAGCKLHACSQVLGDSEVGENCVLLTGAVVGADIPGSTIIGKNNTIGYHAKVGVKCQDKKYKEGDRSFLYVGNSNDIREFTSIHRSSEPNDGTVIGSGNLFMGCCSVAHNCKIGNRNILANGTLLGGQVVIENLVHTGGAASVHPFCHLGSYSFLAGGSMVYHDVPMFTMVAGNQAELRCLNLEGMRRSGFSDLEVRSIRKAYQKLFMSRDPNAGGLKEKLSELDRNEELSKVPAVKQMLRSVGDCFGEKRRGLCNFKLWASGMRTNRKGDDGIGDEAVRNSAGAGEVAGGLTVASDGWIGSDAISEKKTWFSQLVDRFVIGAATRLKGIHATALVDPSAQLGKGVEIGAFCTVGPHVKLGNGCRLEASCHVFGDTQLGDNCVLETGAVVGADIPGRTVVGNNNTIGSCSVVGVECQDMKYKEGDECYLYMGNDNKIGKYTSIHRSSKPKDKTFIGNDNQIMDWCHVAHDCKIGNGNFLASGTLVGGHVVMGDLVCTGGAVAVHQFCHLGSYSFLGGDSVVTRDVPMFVMASGDRAEILSLSVQGMQRYGCSDREVRSLSKVYQELFMSNNPNAGGLEERLSKLDLDQKLSSVPAVTQMLRSVRDCFGEKRRGICGFRHWSPA